jgi:signal transduction histidine kinase
MPEPDAAAVARTPGEAARRIVRLEGAALLASRGAALLNVGIAMITGMHGGQMFALAVVLATALTVESAALGLATLRSDRLPSWVGWLDVAVSCAALAVNAVLVTGQDVHTWGFFAYPYTLVASSACGLLLRGPWRVAAGAVCLAVMYAISDHLASGQPWWNAVPNAGSYLGIAPLVWFVADQLRRLAAELDASRAVALHLAAQEAVSRERNRHSQLLHDRVLQTLETLGRGTWVADPWMREQVRAEAGWLRWVVERGQDGVRVGGLGGAGGSDGTAVAGRASDGGEASDLEAGLHSIVQEQVRRGLDITTIVPPAYTDDLARVPSPVADALLGACYEALTNVMKHAGTDRATVWAAIEDGDVVVGVVDQGHGFDPRTCPERIGLSRSIRGRMKEIGGTTRIDSATGEGTSVELRVPLDAVPDRADR